MTMARGVADVGFDVHSGTDTGTGDPMDGL
jgi:hypothetical protein